MNSRPGTALILGVSGQDGAYLASLLVDRGLEVHGTSRDKEISNYHNLRALGIYDRVTYHSAVLGDFRSVASVLKNVQPAYIFNLAAQSSVGLSFEQPVDTIDSIMHGTINVLEAIRFLSLDQDSTTPPPANASAIPAGISRRTRIRCSARAVRTPSARLHRSGP
jgi:GDPmannose 4,6-dehydratase